MFRHRLGALALFAAFALPLAASAQTAPAPGMAPAPAPAMQRHHRHHHHNRYMHAMRGLGLSAAQKQQIAGIMKNARAQRGQNQAADPQTRRANAQALHQQIEGVLTDSQRTALHAKLAAGRRGAKPNGPAGQAPPQ